MTDNRSNTVNTYSFIELKPHATTLCKGSCKGSTLPSKTT